MPSPSVKDERKEQVICDGCRVNDHWEHRCHGVPCGCLECGVECSGCGAEAPEWKTQAERWFWTSPRPDDGLPDVFCPACQAKEAATERALGLDKEPLDGN